MNTIEKKITKYDFNIFEYLRGLETYHKGQEIELKLQKGPYCCYYISKVPPCNKVTFTFKGSYVENKLNSIEDLYHINKRYDENFDIEPVFLEKELKKIKLEKEKEEKKKNLQNNYKTALTEALLESKNNNKSSLNNLILINSNNELSNTVVKLMLFCMTSERYVLRISNSTGERILGKITKSISNINNGFYFKTGNLYTPIYLNDYKYYM